MMVDGKLRRAIIELRESAKSMRHSGWNNTAEELELLADELETAIEHGTDDLAAVRRIVREELNRQRIGPRCPDCGATEPGVSWAELDRQMNSDEVWSCFECDYSGPAESFDPQERSSTIIRREQIYFEAFCEGVVAGMGHEGEFEDSAEFGDWIRGKFDEWREGSTCDYSDNRS